MNSDKTIQKIVIVGGGPVGNFAALLSCMLGIRTLVYEKRPDYTREINVKIEEGFFERTGELFKRLSRSQDSFLHEFDQLIKERNNKIKLNEIEKRLKDRATVIGATYIERNVKGLDQIYEEHDKKSTLVLDCAGRRSQIRIEVFGEDSESMEIYDLQSAMHLNFRAKVGKHSALELFQIIYPVFKNSPHIKLGQIVISKAKDEQGFSHVTIPLFIEKSLTDEFNQHFPDINRKPLRPFFYAEGHPPEIPACLSTTISSVFLPLVVEDWDIDWASVAIKKIEITCGYARERSRGQIVCLGDSAAHFAYYKSLNIGLNHAAKFFEMLTEYSQIEMKLPPFKEEEIKSIFRKSSPLLAFYSAAPSLFPCKYYITTKAVLYGAFVLDLRNLLARKLDIIPCSSREKAADHFKNYESEKVKEESWKQWIGRYEEWRLSVIKKVVAQNSMKNNNTNIIGKVIQINNLSPIRISETFSYLTKGYSLKAQDFVFFDENLNILVPSVSQKQFFVRALSESLRKVMDYYEGDVPLSFVQFTNNVESLHKDPNFQWAHLNVLLIDLNWGKDKMTHKTATILLKIAHICLQVATHQLKDGLSHQDSSIQLSTISLQE